MIEDHLRAFPPSGSSADDVGTDFTTATLQTAERVAPPRASRVPARGWKGVAQAEVEISMATAASRAAWRQKADTQDSQLIKAVRRENTRFHRVCSDVYEKFLKRHVQGMEKDTWKVNSQYIRYEEGITLRDPGLVLGKWARFFETLLNSISDKLRLDIIE